MMFSSIKTFAFCVLMLPFFAQAQHPDFPGSKRLWLQQPGDLFASYEFTDGSAGKAMLSEFFSKNKAEEIAALSNETAWPEGLNNFEARQSNADLMKKFIFWRVASFTEGEEDMCVVHVSRDENKHMPDNLQPLEENGFFMVFLSAAFSDYNTEDPSNDDMADLDVVEIVDPGELYASFDMLADSNAIQFMASELELAPEEMKNLNELANENGWPKGLSSIETRRSFHPEMKHFTLWRIGSFTAQDGINLTLVFAPFERNQHMAEDLRPTREDGFFMVFGENGVKPKPKR